MPTQLDLRRAQSRVDLAMSRRTPPLAADLLLLQLDAGEITMEDYERLLAEAEGEQRRAAKQRTTGVQIGQMYEASWEHDQRVIDANREVCGGRMTLAEEGAIRRQVQDEFAAAAAERHKRQASGLGGPATASIPLDPDMRAVQGGTPHPDFFRNSVTGPPQMLQPLAPPAPPVRQHARPATVSGAPHQSPDTQFAIGDLAASSSMPLPEGM